MRTCQFDTLCRAPTPKNKAPPPPPSPSAELPVLGKAVPSVTGASVSWHSSLEEVPFDEDAYTMVVANEFFDALPIHQFESAGGRWHERLVGLAEAPPVVAIPASHRPNASAPTAPSSSELCFVRAPSRTASLQASRTLILVSSARRTPPVTSQAHHAHAQT
jgi:hypothetical protein